MVLEIARFAVVPEKVSDLLAGRDAAVNAMRRAFPGLVDAHLGRLDERTWIDVWLWTDMASAKAAADGAFGVPEAAAWFRHIAEVISMEHAEVAHSG